MKWCLGGKASYLSSLEQTNKEGGNYRQRRVPHCVCRDWKLIASEQSINTVQYCGRPLLLRPIQRGRERDLEGDTLANLDERDSEVFLLLSCCLTVRTHRIRQIELTSHSVPTMTQAFSCFFPIMTYMEAIETRRTTFTPIYYYFSASPASSPGFCALH